MSDDKIDKKPTPKGQCAIDVARLYGYEEGECGTCVGALLFLVALYFCAKLLFIVGGGYCKSEGQSKVYLDHQNTNQSAVYLDHQTNHIQRNKR